MGEDRLNLKGIFENNETIENSKSVCPICLELIDCNIIFFNGRVYLRKTCPLHGSFNVLIYSDAKDYINATRYNKLGSKPLHHQSSVSEGCPNDCGLCEEHRQHTCVGIIEITDMCNLHCPVCFADSSDTYTLPLSKIKEMIDLYVKCEGNPEVLQISGGEPTLHPDIFDILKYAGEKGITYPVLNTNGIKLADRDFAEKISRTIRNSCMNGIGNPVIYLQFDGLSDETYVSLRGRPLFNIKMDALENCRKLGMNVALVPTIIEGVNDDEIGAILETAFDDDNIKMVNFQPATFTGRNKLLDKHLTIPDILEKIEKQSGGLLNKKDFLNIPCPYPTCSVCSYIYNDKITGNHIVLTRMFDKSSYEKYILNRALPDLEFTSQLEKCINAIDSLLSMSSLLGSENSVKSLCTLCQKSIPDSANMVDNITLVSVHAFMDEYNFDLKRAKKCCVTQILPDGRMIPFCVYNILYRKSLHKQCDIKTIPRKGDNGIKEIVKYNYSRIAKKGELYGTIYSSKKTPDDVSKLLGYTEKDICKVPESSNLGLGCGNPVALASLNKGDTVLDLGCGAGFDCFLASDKVGENGWIIGVDMTPEMLEKAKENSRKRGYSNVEFRQGEIENLPVNDNSVDVVLSNCVINLSPEKGKVFDEIYRVLKPEGKFIVSDIVLLQEIPEKIKDSVQAYVGCISGAILKRHYLDIIMNTGFSKVSLIDESKIPIDVIDAIIPEQEQKKVMDDFNLSYGNVKSLIDKVISIRIEGKK
ncbi:arsenite methyltransferase [Methanohalobium sp.]|uniref:arsenite methyltransferase n=1 Tax=Methanohalobium sp. TaxID=2837493 RepID=UPI0025FAF8EB|nr:arsenite methyltransferase [Methanohalobium sp.]